MLWHIFSILVVQKNLWVFRSCQEQDQIRIRTYLGKAWPDHWPWEFCIRIHNTRGKSWKHIGRKRHSSFSLEIYSRIGLAALFHFTPPPPRVKVYICMQLQTACGWERVGGGVESRWRGFTLCMWPDSESTKLLTHPKQKSRRAGGLKQITNCCKVLMQVTFKTKKLRHCLLWVYLSMAGK